MADAHRPDLPASAQAAWRAYQAMAESKSAHLGLLERCNEKRERGESPTIAEQLHLEELLSQHDLRVQAFSAAMKALRESEPAALAALVQLMR